MHCNEPVALGTRDVCVGRAAQWWDVQLTSCIEIEGRAAGSNGVYVPADSAARTSGTPAVAVDSTVAKVAVQLSVKRIQRWQL